MSRPDPDQPGRRAPWRRPARGRDSDARPPRAAPVPGGTPLPAQVSPSYGEAAKQRSGSVTAPGPVKQRPAGWSPFAGIARIRSLGVAVQPLSCPRPLSLSSRLRVSPALRSVQLPRSPRRRYSRCMGPVTVPRAESPACTGRTSCFPEARGLAGRRRSCFQVWPARPFTGGGLSPGRERRSGHRAGAARCRTGPGEPPVGTGVGPATEPFRTLRRFGEVRPGAEGALRGWLAYVPVPVQPGCDLDVGGWIAWRVALGDGDLRVRKSSVTDKIIFDPGVTGSGRPGVRNSVRNQCPETCVTGLGSGA